MSILPPTISLSQQTELNMYTGFESLPYISDLVIARTKDRPQDKDKLIQKYSTKDQCILQAKSVSKSATLPRPLKTCL